MCRELLCNLNFRPWYKSFVSLADDPPDVMYRRARFEVKEILDQGRKRHKEYQDALYRALKATDPSELLEHYSPEAITPEQVGNLIGDKLITLQNKYPSKTKASLDLLFYVNLINIHLQQGSMPPTSSFSAFGWRSISAVFGIGALVFFADHKAPRFLRDYAGTLSLKRSRYG